MGSARSRGSSGGGDRVIESRHLIGVFFAVVVLCGVFFTLGYVMGRAERGSGVSLAATAEKNASSLRPEPKEAQNGAPIVPAPTDWDFYPPKPGKEAKNPSGAAPSSQREAGSVAHAPAQPSPARFKPPLIPRGAFLLQVAALAHESDALGLADALQQKSFPAFVIARKGDNLYRVQVGPYADSKSAEIAKRALQREGFKTLIKR